MVVANQLTCIMKKTGSISLDRLVPAIQELDEVEVEAPPHVHTEHKMFLVNCSKQKATQWHPITTLCHSKWPAYKRHRESRLQQRCAGAESQESDGGRPCRFRRFCRLTVVLVASHVSLPRKMIHPWSCNRNRLIGGTYHIFGLCFWEYPSKIWPCTVQYLHFRIQVFFSLVLHHWDW